MSNIQIKPGSSMERVMNAARDLGLNIELRVMDQSTRTAEDAAKACGCDVAQIVKSLIFEHLDSGEINLLLVSGKHNADLDYIKTKHGLKLGRVDGRRVRDETGFAIGGVAPIGHLVDLPIYMDTVLTGYETVWAAAGRPDSVFRVDPVSLSKAKHMTIIDVTA